VANASSANTRQSFYVLCSVFLVTAVLYWAQKILIPVALAILLAFILTPAVSALQRRGLGRVLSVLVVTALVFLFLGSIGWVISKQVAGLASRLASQEYQREIVQKIENIQGTGEGGLIGRLRNFLDGVKAQLVEHPSTPETREGPGAPADEPGNEEGPKARPGESSRKANAAPPGATAEKPLYVTTASSGWSRVLELAGPAGEGLASAFLVVVLTVFMLVQRENLRNRIVRLVGHGRIVVTVRAFDEGARRISRFLLMQVFVNTSFALALSVGLFLLGLYADEPGRPALRTTAVLWGFLAFTLRFVPYLGSWVAAALLVLFSVAALPGWTLPLVVLAYFILLELLTANVLEPLLFGHSTGSSPLALLLAAAFWTWLWGPVGLLLSTPLTVILVVLGKYVPQLQFFDVLLGDEPPLVPAMTLYQRLVARDQDEASDLVDEYLEGHGVEEFYGEVLLPALIRARRDRDRDELDRDDLHFVYHAAHDILEDVAAQQPELAAKEDAPPAALVCCPARDEGDELALRTFAATLRPLGHAVEVLSGSMLAAEVLERISGSCPAIVCIGSLPPGGLAQTRYLCKRIRAQCRGVKIAVGRWGDTAENLEQVQQRLRAAGADFVARTLAESRAQVVPLLQVAAVAGAASDKVTPARPTGQEPALVGGGSPKAS
jgi:predicted PurR-regulated permease PerM